MIPSMPPDGFADEASGPPDGFADESVNTAQDQPGLVQKAFGMSPLGMVSSGANAISQGINKAFTPFIPVPESVQHGAQAMFRPFRAAGVGVAENFTGASPMQTTQKTVQAFQPGYQPQGPVENIGATLGENAPVVAASALSPSVGGPLSFMAQQAQGGKVSPVPLLMPAVQGAGRLFEAAKPKIVPPLMKVTKGTPYQVSRMALEDPSILDLPGTSESIQGKSQGIINAIKGAGRKVGEEYGSSFNEAGMKSPVENIIEKGTPPAIPFEKLRGDYHLAMSGELLNGLSDKEKLATLTDLKRSLQDTANYPQPGQQLGPTQGSTNGAIKKMAADIDALRGKLPGGDKLAVADDAWSEMKELKHRLMGEFRDPYKGQDYLNRLLKGNTDWLTSGRNAGKMGAIQRIEEITGKDVLKPALKELAAAYLKNPDVLSLPSWKWQSLISHLIPNKLFFGSLPKAVSSASSGIGATAALSNLTEKTAREFWTKAKEEGLKGKELRTRAEELASQAGYKWQ